MLSKKRKIYLRNWRLKNRPKIREYFNHYIKHGRITPKLSPEELKKKRQEYEKNRIRIRYNSTKCSRPVKMRVGENNYIGTSGIGRKYELIALNLLGGSIDSVGMNPNCPYDIEWNGIKIDVKSRKSTGEKYSWDFNKKNESADYFLLFCLSKDDMIIKILFIPKDIFGYKIHLGLNSKYDKFKLKFSKELVSI